MSVAWPTTLPQSPQRSGYSFQEGDGRVATDMQQGPPRYRRMYTNVPTVFQLVFSMTAAQKAAFDTFYDGTLAGGTISVNIPVRTSGGNTTVAVYIQKRSAVQIDDSDAFMVGLQVITA